jgi:hypothetical protein
VLPQAVTDVKTEFHPILARVQGALVRFNVAVRKNDENPAVTCFQAGMIPGVIF